MLSDSPGYDAEHGSQHQRDCLPRARAHGCLSIEAILGACPGAVNMAAMRGAWSGAVAVVCRLARINVRAPAVASGGTHRLNRSHDDCRCSRIVATMRDESASQYSGSSRMELPESRSDCLTCPVHVLADRRRCDVEHGRDLRNVESTLDHEIEALPLHSR